MTIGTIPADAVAGKDGTARYKYKVSDAQYSATGAVTAYIDPTDCGSSELSWAAGVTTKLSDGFLPWLGGLDRGRNASASAGTDASATCDVRVPVQSSLDGQITDIVCTDEGSHFEVTPCKEGPVDGDIEVSGDIDASVGTKVTVTGSLAEGVGFEPTDRENPVNSFQGCRIQPLCHPSGDRFGGFPMAEV